VACALLALAPLSARAQRLGVLFQVDYQHGQESVDQLDDADGQPLNQNRVLIPRARLKLSEEWRYFELAVEADFNTVAGPQVGMRQLEAALVWPPHPEAPFPNFRFTTSRPAKPAVHPERAERVEGPEAAPPPADPPPPREPTLLERYPLQLRLGGGIFRAPFGHDVYELSHADRLFAQPSLLAQAFFPGEFDLGARLSARWRWVGLVVAMQNGEPLGTRAFPGADPNADKDFFARLTVDAAPFSWLKLEAGASGTVGTGFHPGTPATKDTLVWRDLNEDGIAQLGELTAIRGSAATPSQNFSRWGVAGDLRLKARLPLGELTLFGEAALGHNLDRGLRPADPVLLGRAQRSTAVFGGFTQEILGRVLVGFRADHYLAALDESRFEGGTLVRSLQPFTHYSFALAYCFGSSLPFGKGRLMADYTLRRDPLGRDAAGRPADLKNDLFTLRLQLEL
jgi:hypothetical protein